MELVNEIGMFTMKLSIIFSNYNSYNYIPQSFYPLILLFLKCINSHARKLTVFYYVLIDAENALQEDALLWTCIFFTLRKMHIIEFTLTKIYNFFY